MHICDCSRLYALRLWDRMCIFLFESAWFHSAALLIWHHSICYFNYRQGLCEWRDGVARAEDESTGYVLPNKTLLEIGSSPL